MSDPTATRPETGTIMVTGMGRVVVDPDVADLRLGVTIVRPTVSAARQEAATTMTAILKAVTETGVARRDVRTTLLSVQPRYDYRDGQSPDLTGYELTNVVEVTVRDLSKLAEVVDGSLRAGATSMDGLSFRLAAPAQPEREARILAMTAARARADVLAEAADLTIIGVADIIEGDAVRPPSPLMKAERMAMADASMPVESGSLEIAVVVTVTYRTR